MSRAPAGQEALAAFMRALQGIGLAQAQNRLLSMADRDLAALLFIAGEEERARVFAIVGAAKTARLRGQLERMRHVHLGAESLNQIAEHLIEHLTGTQVLGPASRYFRPRRPT